MTNESEKSALKTVYRDKYKDDVEKVTFAMLALDENISIERIDTVLNTWETLYENKVTWTLGFMSGVQATKLTDKEVAAHRCDTIQNLGRYIWWILSKDQEKTTADTAELLNNSCILLFTYNLMGYEFATVVTKVVEYVNNPSILIYKALFKESPAEEPLPYDASHPKCQKTIEGQTAFVSVIEEVTEIPKNLTIGGGRLQEVPLPQDKFREFRIALEQRRVCILTPFILLHDKPVQHTYEELLLSTFQMAKRKNSNYGNSVAKSPSLIPDMYPQQAILVRMSDKLARLQSLYAGEQDKVGESLRDTWVDLGNYLCLCAAVVNLQSLIPEEPTGEQLIDELEVVYYRLKSEGYRAGHSQSKPHALATAQEVINLISNQSNTLEESCICAARAVFSFLTLDGMRKTEDGERV